MDANRQWFKARVGLTLTETPREFSICTHAIMEDAPPVFVLPNIAKDCRFRELPSVLEYPKLLFYAGASLEVDGVRVGTLCLMDTKVRDEDSFGENEIEMLKDLGKIVSDMISQRRKKNLANHHQTLHFDEKILKLLQIPLRHIEESKQRVATALTALKEGLSSNICKTRENSLRLISKLLQEAKGLSREVNRFMPISTAFTRLLVEIYQLEYCQTLSMNELSHREGSIHKALSPMCEEDIRKELEEFYKISFDRSFKQSVREDHRYVDVKWINPASVQQMTTNPPESILYTYPTFMKLLIMLMYGLFDYHQKYVQMTIELQPERKEVDSFVLAGQWMIKVEEIGSFTCFLAGRKRAKVEDLLDLFSVINSISNCHHTVSHELKSPSGEKFKSTENKTYEISIPAYEFTYCQDDSTKTMIYDSHQEEEGEEYHEIIQGKEKRKRKQLSPVSSFLLTPFHVIKNQWKQYNLIKRMRRDSHHPHPPSHYYKSHKIYASPTYSQIISNSSSAEEE